MQRGDCKSCTRQWWESAITDCYRRRSQGERPLPSAIYANAMLSRYIPRQRLIFLPEIHARCLLY